MSNKSYQCPSCAKIFSEKTKVFPFCCERCKTNDLGAWASEDYKLKGSHASSDEVDFNISSGSDENGRN